MAYIYKEQDQKKLDEHIAAQENSPVYFQNSYAELITVNAWRKVLKDIEEGKDIKEELIKCIHDILTD